MKKRVLILCTGNSCRSQMAAGLWKHLGGKEWDACSAGSEPAGYVHPLAIAARAEIGLDISGYKSKHMNTFVDQPFDLIVTVCDQAQKACPTWPGKETLHWPLEDPATVNGDDEARQAAFRGIRAQIADQIRAYLGG